MDIFAEAASALGTAETSGQVISLPTGTERIASLLALGAASGQALQRAQHLQRGAVQCSWKLDHRMGSSMQDAMAYAQQAAAAADERSKVLEAQVLDLTSKLHALEATLAQRSEVGAVYCGAPPQSRSCPVACVAWAAPSRPLPPPPARPHAHHHTRTGAG